MMTRVARVMRIEMCDELEDLIALIKAGGHVRFHVAMSNRECGVVVNVDGPTHQVEAEVLIETLSGAASVCWVVRSEPPLNWCVGGLTTT